MILFFPIHGRIFSCHQNEENTKLTGYSSCLVVYLITGYLPEPTRTCCFERSNNFMDWHKYIPFPMRLLSTAASEWPETTSGMVQKLLLCWTWHDEQDRQPSPMNSLAFDKTHSYQNQFYFCFNSGKFHCLSGVTEVEELVHSSQPQIPTQILPTIVKNEQDIVVLYVCEFDQQSTLVLDVMFQRNG